MTSSLEGKLTEQLFQQPFMGSSPLQSSGRHRPNHAQSPMFCFLKSQELNKGDGMSNSCGSKAVPFQHLSTRVDIPQKEASVHFRWSKKVTECCGVLTHTKNVCSSAGDADLNALLPSAPRSAPKVEMLRKAPSTSRSQCRMARGIE